MMDSRRDKVSLQKGKSFQKKMAVHFWDVPNVLDVQSLVFFLILELKDA